MSVVAVRVEGLGKQYRLGQREPYKTLRDALARGAAAPFRYARSALKRGPHLTATPKREPFWALKDVAFEVREGEAIGIIGRNGSGKSTLLKILSRITEPTEGRAEIHGRVGSLLEVGTGFHPELTGRENVYLNGAILGMGKAEIKRKFDEIVAFAEIEKFLDTPVKRYSSGMYVRLAFSVAAHLDPEILLVDEVLAVGDFAFQQKCLAKMRDVSMGGRTVLFVSHNLGAIGRLTDRCLLLVNGHLERFDATHSVVQTYVTSVEAQRAEYVQGHAPEKPMNLLRIAACDASGQPRTHMGYHERISCLVEYEVNRRVTNGVVAVGVFTGDGTCAFLTGDFDARPELLELRLPGRYQAEVKIPEKLLSPGRYTLTVYLTSSATNEVYDEIGEVVAFTVVETGSPGSRLGLDQRRGVFQPLLDWTTRRLDP